MKAENLLSLKQYGFINGISTTTQLLSYLNKCIDTIVSGGVLGTVYFDFAKAFQSVPHERLLGKLKSYSFNGKVLEWIKTFLSNGCQVVNVNRMKSDPATILSVISHGSNLGPIPFAITHTEKYSLHRQELEHVFEPNDLGIILNAEFDERIS